MDDFSGCVYITNEGTDVDVTDDDGCAKECFLRDKKYHGNCCPNLFQDVDVCVCYYHFYEDFETKCNLERLRTNRL